MMANGIKVLHHRALSAEDDLNRVVRRTKAKNIDTLRSDLATLRQANHQANHHAIIEEIQR